MLSRITYYLSSIPTILGQIKNWYALPKLLGQKPIIVHLHNGLQFTVRNLMDVWVLKETCLDRDYEVNGVQIEDGWHVIDIGAGLGDFSILTAYEHPNSQVYAFEPFPESFELLQTNKRLNGSQNIHTFQIAVSSKSKHMQLLTTGEAVQHTTTDSTVSGTASSMIEVEGLSLADVLKVNEIAHCHFLKLDCEGSEFDILLNATAETLQKFEHICLEYHDGFTEFSHGDLVAHLQKQGFTVSTTPNPVHNYLGFLYARRQP